jgi:hypothetical protein
MTRFHFDLRHVSDAADLRVDVHGAEFELNPHDGHSLAAARSDHVSLAALPLAAHQTFSHFSDVDDEHLDKFEGIRWIRVMRPAPEGVHLDEPVLVGMHLPDDVMRAYYKAHLEPHDAPTGRMRGLAVQGRTPSVHSGKLAMLGLKRLPEDQDAALDVLVSAQELVGPLDNAATLVQHHPDLANIQPYTAAVIRNDHILPEEEVNPDQYNAMQVLKDAIVAAGDDWSPRVPCTDRNGKHMVSEYEMPAEWDKDGKGWKKDVPLYTWDIADSVARAALPATAGARRTVMDDTRLAGKSWSPTPGTSALVKQDPPIQLTPVRVEATGVSGAYKWTVDERTDHHGISINQKTIKVDDKGTVSIDASNSYLRTCYMGYRLLDDKRNPISDLKLIASLSATNTVLGIPTDTDPTTILIDLTGAAGVELHFGSLGVTDWDDDVSNRGALLTGLWQYGVPIVFLVAGAALTSTKTYNKIVNDRDLTAIAIAILFSTVTPGVATAAALTNCKKVLTSFGDAVLGLALKQGMERLGKWLIEKAGTGALSAAFGPVGWVFRLAAGAMDIEEMAVTTGEVLSSPACIKVTATRAIDVSVTMHPDPKHGESGHPDTAVWPSVAATYQATLQYKSGTSFELKGKMPAQTNKDPLPLTFTDVPAGGQFRINVGIYSANGWLAGAWQSDWTTAQPTNGTTLELGDKSIKESLVPLAPDTQYVFKERIAASQRGLAWQAGGAPPATTQTALDCASSSSLCELVDITINNSAFQVGYAWRASGQNLPPDEAGPPDSQAQLYAVQNLSVLAEPASRLKTADVGLTNRPAIAYAPSTQGDTIDQQNFVLDPRGGGMHLRQVVLDDGQATFGLGHPDLLSWGRFPLENVDAIAVHPSNAVIGCSWKDHKLMILDLPAGPVADKDAPLALPVSGPGLRQGLTAGPKALAVAPDGRILVLESLNRRVQAFDTKGNPVPSFTPGPMLFSLETAQIAAALDRATVPDEFQAALQLAGVTVAATLDAAFASELDTAKFQPADDPLLKALAAQGVTLAYDPDAPTDPTASSQIVVENPGKSWKITDPRAIAWQITAGDAGLTVYRQVTQVDVHLEKAGQRWLLVDRALGSAWRLAPSTGAHGRTEVRSCLSFFPLRQPRVGAGTYLDMAVEAAGHVYVLSYLNDGSKTTDYILDVYGPDGTFLFRTPDPSVTHNPQNVVAGRIAVDVWRNLFALTYEPLHNPGPQPGLAHWTPTPPLFALPLASQPDFNQRNIGAVTQAFRLHGIDLTKDALISVIDEDGAWSVKDGATVYHIYRSGDGLQIYAVPA